MSLKEFRFDGSEPCRISELRTAAKNKKEKDSIVKKMEENLRKIAILQEKLYADGREGLVIVLQAMDAAGKDSTIKHAFSSINPQGVDITSFKQPTSEDLSHDYLWRAANALPRRGKIAIFNRSYYEDVLVVSVHDLQKNYKMAERCMNDKKEEFFKKRYHQIRNFEEYLYENSYRVVKIFLHVSPEEQKKRFLERLDNPAKNWKFSASDLAERQLWDRYMTTYETVINETATKHSPWYILPADDKWYTRYLVTEIMIQTLEQCDPQFPALAEQAVSDLAACKGQLIFEEQNKK